MPIFIFIYSDKSNKNKKQYCIRGVYMNDNKVMDELIFELEEY